MKKIKKLHFGPGYLKYPVGCETCGVKIFPAGISQRFCKSCGKTYWAEFARRYSSQYKNAHPIWVKLNDKRQYMRLKSNPEKLKERYLYAKEWRKLNPGYMSAYNKRRKDERM